jgi:tetratricopeptide (TPR) repeat protein
MKLHYLLKWKKIIENLILGLIVCFVLTIIGLFAGSLKVVYVIIVCIEIIIFLLLLRSLLRSVILYEYNFVFQSEDSVAIDLSRTNKGEFKEIKPKDNNNEIVGKHNCVNSNMQGKISEYLITPLVSFTLLILIATGLHTKAYIPRFNISVIVLILGILAQIIVMHKRQRKELYSSALVYILIVIPVIGLLSSLFNFELPFLKEIAGSDKGLFLAYLVIMFYIIQRPIIYNYEIGESLKDLYSQGEECYSKGNYRHALAYYNRAIKLDKDNSKVYYMRGVCNEKLSNFESAIADYSLAIEINPNYADAFNSRGNVKERIGQNKDAISDYIKAIEINPDYGNDYFYEKRGDTNYNAENFRDALFDFSKAIQINPEDSTTYFKRALVNEKIKDLKSAIADYSKAIELNSAATDAYFNRGVIRIQINSYKSAIDDFTKVLNLEPEFEGVYFKRGIAKFHLEDYEGAIEDYKREIKNNRNNGEFYFKMGEAKDRLGDNNGAKRDYSMAYYLEGKDTDDYLMAIQYYSKAINYRHDFADAYNNRGVAKYCGSGDLKGAIADYTKAIEINPDYADAYYNRGIAKINLGKKNSGCLDLSKAGELGDDDAYEAISDHCN